MLIVQLLLCAGVAGLPATGAVGLLVGGGLQPAPMPMPSGLHPMGKSKGAGGVLMGKGGGGPLTKGKGAGGVPMGKGGGGPLMGKGAGGPNSTMGKGKGAGGVPMGKGGNGPLMGKGASGVPMGKGGGGYPPMGKGAGGPNSTSKGKGAGGLMAMPAGKGPGGPMSTASGRSMAFTGAGPATPVIPGAIAPFTPVAKGPGAYGKAGAISLRSGHLRANATNKNATKSSLKHMWMVGPQAGGTRLHPDAALALGEDRLNLSTNM